MSNIQSCMILPTLAIIVPAYNEGAVITGTIKTLSSILEKLKANSQISFKSFILIVDDGSVDETWVKVKKLHSDSPSEILGLKLTRNFGHQHALLAGLLQAQTICDITISIDADLQHDPNIISNFIQSYKDGADIVFGVRKDRSSDSVFKNLSAKFFYRFMKHMGVPIIENHADYRLMSSRAINTLAQYCEPNLFLRALCLQLGYKTDVVYFEVSPRQLGSSKYTLAKMFKLGITGITSFSERPLHIISMIGILIFGASILMGIYILFQTLVMDNVVPGWASTTLPIYALGGLQLLCLAIIGEYIAQIFTATKARPRFSIEETLP